MKTIMRSAMAAALMLSAGSLQLAAQRTTDNPYRYWNVCGGVVSTFATCAAVDIELVAAGQMQMRVWNLSGNTDRYGIATPTNTVFTGIGFFNVGDVSATAGSLSMSGPQHLNSAGEAPRTWTLINDETTNPDGTVNEDTDGVHLSRRIRLEMMSTTPLRIDDGIIRDCEPADQFPGGDNNYWANPCATAPDWNDNAGWVVFNFNFSGDWGNLANSELLLWGQDGFTRAKAECVTGGEYMNCYDANDVVPEPITMTLFGTGLLGVGLARRRRRKTGEIVDA